MPLVDSPPATALDGYLVLDPAIGRYRYACCGLASPIRVAEVDGPDGPEWSLACDCGRESHLLEHALTHSKAGVFEIVNAILSHCVRGD